MAKYNSKKGPFEAYDGEDKYIFISYKHADSEVVFPIIKRFHDAGFNIWYDDGLKYGDDYDDLIDFKIDKSSLFVICITETVIDKAYDSDEYMKKELDVAMDTNTKMFPLFLDNVGLKGKYRMQLRGLHSIFRHEYENEDDFIEECLKAFREDFEIEPNALDSHEIEEAEVFEEDGESDDLKTDDPPLSYMGSEPYIYVSYSHQDFQEVFGDIKRFQEDGFNVAYDYGLVPGNEWMGEIAKTIAGASLLVAFISKNYLESKFVLKEILFALNKDIQVLPIYLEDVELDGDLELRLAATESILRYSLPREDYVKIYREAFRQNGLKELQSNSNEESSLKKSQNKYNFKYLDSLIADNQEIVLKSDIVFDDTGYENGIEIKREGLVIDGNGHTIDAKGKARIFRLSASNVQFKNITFSNGSAYFGGALYISQGNVVKVDSCTFENNHCAEDGGAILNRGDLRISESRFSANASKNRGGAIKNAEFGILTVIASEFDENEGVDGGAIANLSDAIIDESIFSKNTAEDSAGALLNLGECKVENSDFNSNRSNTTIKGNGGGALFNFKGSLKVALSKFENNFSNIDGGAAYNHLGEMSIDFSNFKGNTAKSAGNSIMNIDDSSLKIKESVFDESKSKVISSGEIQFIGNSKFTDDSGAEKFLRAFSEFKKKSSEKNSKTDQLLKIIDSTDDVSLPSGDIVDKLADRIYKSYESVYEKHLAGAYREEIREGRIPDPFFDRLDNFKLKKGEFKREAEIRLKAIYSIGCEVVNSSDKRDGISGFTSGEEIEIAKFNHYLWCAKKLKGKYEYGDSSTGFNDLLVRDPGLTTSRKSDVPTVEPYIDSVVLWDEMKGDEKQANIDFVNEIFKLLPDDLKIVRH